MDTVTISILRFDPTQNKGPCLQRFVVPTENGATVQQALFHIYDQQDSTLGFGYSCRFRNCGLCALEVDDKPRMACLTPLKDGQVLKPLRHLPVLRDLLIDRSWVFDNMRDLQLFTPETKCDPWPQPVFESEEHRRLMQCTDCLACMATCPHYDYKDPSFGGTFTFVKLGQLHFDPRDKTDRVVQAKQLGIERCTSCQRCVCIMGVPAWRSATKVLLQEGSEPE